MVRAVVVDILIERWAGHSEGWALTVEWEWPLVVKTRVRRYRLLYVQRTWPWSLIGYWGVRGRGLFAEWVCPCSVGGAARRDGRRGRG